MTLFEFCAESASGAIDAAGSGADRIELCADLSVGGITPAPDDLRRVLDETDIPVFAMARPRGGSFVFDDDEVELTCGQLEQAHELGAHGFVVGAIDSQRRIDVRALTRWVAAAQGRPVTFHRAFDELADPFDALSTLAELGVRRILTSGAGASAWEGRARIRELIEHAPRELTIIAGGGVRQHNVHDLVEATGAIEVHGSAPIDLRRTARP